MELFSGCYRPSGRVFLSHLIGAASIAAHFDARSEVVAAGLLHAVYSHGEFGDGTRGVTDAKREVVCREAGAAVEERVHRYGGLRWDAAGVERALHGLSTADAVKRDVLLLELANSLDDYWDAAMAPSGAAACREHIRRRGALEIDLAAKLGFAALASAHTRVQSLAMARSAAGRDFRMLEPIECAIRLTGPGSSFVVPPASHQRKVGVWLRGRLGRYSMRRLRHRLGRALLLRG